MFGQNLIFMVIWLMIWFHQINCAKKKIFVIYDLTNFVFLISRNNDVYIFVALWRERMEQTIWHTKADEANLIFRADFFFFRWLLPVKDKLSCVINEEKWQYNWPKYEYTFCHKLKAISISMHYACPWPMYLWWFFFRAKLQYIFLFSSTIIGLLWSTTNSFHVIYYDLVVLNHKYTQ